MGDAITSLPVGSAWQKRNRITPLIHPPSGALRRAISIVEDNEVWLVTPKQDPTNPHLLCPGLKLGVSPGSFSPQTELFGPVLSALRADDLAHALQIANATPYGLTAGLQSLDEGEQRQFLKTMTAGNLYVNRPTTGAIVQRQPFGGHKRSSVGPGAKAGGPNYLLQIGRGEGPLPTSTVKLSATVTSFLMTLADLSTKSMCWLRLCATSDEEHFNSQFGRIHDPSAVLGQSNELSYRPATDSWVRLMSRPAPPQLARTWCAGLRAGTKLRLSIPPGLEPMMDWSAYGDAFVETADEFLDMLRAQPPERLRCLETADETILRVAADGGCHVNAQPVAESGRLEMLHYLREQAVSSTIHRYGNLSLHDRLGASPSPQ